MNMWADKNTIFTYTCVHKYVYVIHIYVWETDKLRIRAQMLKSLLHGISSKMCRLIIDILTYHIHMSNLSFPI